MKIRTLTPYDNIVLRYTSDKETLFVCETEISSFEVLLSDAQSVRDSVFYFQKDNAENVLQVTAQYGQSINGVEKITIYGQYQSVMLVSDGENYRLLQGYVPELPVTLPIGKWIFKTDSDNNFMQYVNTSGNHGAPSWKPKRGITENA